MNKLPIKTGLLTRAGGAHGDRVVRALAAAGYAFHAIVYENPLRLRRRIVTDGGRRESGFELARFAPGRIRQWGQLELHESTRLASHAECVIATGPLNSAQMLEDLRRLELDVLILGDVSIVDERILTVTRLGAVNVHPALLPWARGTGVVGRSLMRGFPVGCSVHFVERGIDTGAIIERRLLPMQNRGTSLADLELRADDLAARTLVDVIARTLARGTVPQGVRQEVRYPYCSWLTAAERRTLDLSVRNGLANTLLHRWRSEERCDSQLVVRADLQHLTELQYAAL